MNPTSFVLRLLTSPPHVTKDMIFTGENVGRGYMQLKMNYIVYFLIIVSGITNE